MPFLLKILKALNSNQRPGEIAAGASFALLLGLLPGENLLWIALFALTFFLKVNLAVQMALLVFFKLLAPAVDPLLHLFGYAILTFPPLFSFFTWIQNAPLLAFTRLNNTLVTGGFAAGVLLWLPSFVFFRFLIRRYREGFLRMIQNTKLYRAFMKLPLVVKFQKAARAVSHLPGRNR
jgi:uncharacterized protein (TIGR03546 family)